MCWTNLSTCTARKKMLILPLSPSLCLYCWFALLTFLTNMWVANFCFNMILASILIVYSSWLSNTDKDVWGCRDTPLYVWLCLLLSVCVHQQCSIHTLSWPLSLHILQKVLYLNIVVWQGFSQNFNCIVWILHALCALHLLSWYCSDLHQLLVWHFVIVMNKTKKVARTVVAHG